MTDPAPWPVSTPTQLAQATVVPIVHTVTVSYQPDPDYLADPVFITLTAVMTDVDLDASRFPMGIATVVATGMVFGTDIPRDAFTWRAAKLYVTADYRWNTLGAPLGPSPGYMPDRVIYAGVVTGVEDVAGGQRITAETYDALHDTPHVGGPLTVSQTATTGGQALGSLPMRSAGTPNGMLVPLRVRDSLTRPPIPDANTVALLRQLTLDPGDRVADLVQAAVDAYPNATTLPDRTGEYVELVERITPTMGNALDLRPLMGLVLAQPLVTTTTDDWASVVRFTATWTDSTGEERSQTLVRTNLANPNSTATPFARSRDVNRQLRPPGDDLNNQVGLVWAALERLQNRTWRATVQAKPALWVLPGTPAVVGPGLLGVVTSVRFTLPNNVMAVSVRPI